MQKGTTRRSFLAGSAAAFAAASLYGAELPATRPVRKPGARHTVPPQMTYIANDFVKVGIDLALGGSITHVSPAKEPERNLVNSWDLGRQIQMSYYAGPVPYTVEGHAGPREAWTHIGWNPIQVGDDFGNPAKVLEHRNDGKSLYVKCLPMQWPLDNVPGECTFECTITLEGPAVRVTSKLNMNRADKTQWTARTQECPAVYTNGPWCRLFTYTGEAPFTNADLEEITHDFTPKSPWANWLATENWAAQVDDKDWGLGVWNPTCMHFGGGFAGKKGKGGPHDSPTGYIAPNRQEIIDHNIVHEYSYALVLGHLKEIRKWVYDQTAAVGRIVRPKWTFEQNRQGWFYRNATDAGWPIKGELDVSLAGKNPQIQSPPTAWQAADGPVLSLEAAFTGAMKDVAVYWGTAKEPGFSAKRVAIFAVQGDGTMRTYSFELAKNPAYTGLITQIRMDPRGAGHEADRVRIKSVAVR